MLSGSQPCSVCEVVMIVNKEHFLSLPYLTHYFTATANRFDTLTIMSSIDVGLNLDYYCTMAQPQRINVAVLEIPYSIHMKVILVYC